jgi:DNA polymerase-3 subunit epsilon
MVGLADRVDPIPCAHSLEAQVRELRLIAAHKPRYNRRSKFPERSVWLKLTDEPFPRLSIVRDVRADNAAYLGPLRSHHQAQVVREALHDAVPLRQCNDRLSLLRSVRPACMLAGIGRCSAPCEDGHSTHAQYDQLAELVRNAWIGDITPLIAPLRLRLSMLSAQQRFEQAATVRDRITAIVRACTRMQRITSLTSITELVAACPDMQGGWNLVVVRYGKLAAAGTAARGTSPWPVIDALVATADVVASGPGPVPAALAEETEAILRWLEQPGTRLVQLTQPWSQPAFGAGSMGNFLAVEQYHQAADPFRDRRALRMQAQPARSLPSGG